MVNKVEEDERAFLIEGDFVVQGKVSLPKSALLNSSVAQKRIINTDQVYNPAKGGGDCHGVRNSLKSKGLDSNR